ncbi:hypothetical protein, partial [Streptomyces fildesensis]|uniref:hypothetical protein n=1 Tax=Streptomyces fildesensis TaxID=375757 RepID=UPI0018E0137A
MESERGKMMVRNLVIGMLFITVITPLFMDTDRIPSFRPSAPRDQFREDIMPLTVLADSTHLNALSTQETSFVLKEFTGIVQSDNNGELLNATIEDSADSQSGGSREHASSNV